MAVTRYCPRCLTTFTEDVEPCSNLGCRAARPAEGWPTLLGVGDTLDRTYRILAILAGGAAGMAYRAREIGPDDSLTGPDLAIKVLYAQRDSGPFLRRLATEAQVLQDLAHPHIVECLGFVHRAGRAPYLVTRYEAGGTLQHHLGRVGPLPPWVAAAAVGDIIDALAVAHAAGVVHRDLKPGNVLLSAEVDAHTVPDVKVADFGIAKVQGGLSSGTRMGSFLGTPEYAAPEQLLGAEPTGAADLFAAGGVLWFLLTGDLPVRLSHRHDPQACHDELLDQLPRTLPKEVRDHPGGPAAQEVLHGLMAPDPRDRWSAADTKQALREVAGQRGSAPRPRAHADAAIGAGGTIFVHSDSTFLWSPEEDGREPSPPPPPARAELPATAGRFRTRTPDAGTAEARPPEAPRTPTAPRSSLDELFFGPAPAAVKPTPASPPSTPASPGGGERPVAERALALPHDPDAAIRVLGAANDEDVGRYQEAVTRLDDRAVAEALRRAWRDGNPEVRRGAALLVQAAARVDQVSNLRNLVRDPVAAVRAAVAGALGATAGGSLLPQLARMGEDPEPTVRSAAALALGQAWRRDGDLKRGREQVGRLAQDPDARVRAAAAAAQEMLR